MKRPFEGRAPIPLTLVKKTEKEFTDGGSMGMKDVTRQYVEFTTIDEFGMKTLHSYSADGIIGLEQHIGVLIQTIEADGVRAKAGSRMESDREVLWHTVDQAYGKLEQGKVEDAISLLYESLVSCSPPSLGGYPSFVDPITPLTVGSALAGMGDKGRTTNRPGVNTAGVKEIGTTFKTRSDGQEP